jgi:hypothetical protein
MATEKEFAVCVDNSDYPTALEVRKVYQLLPDPAAQSHSYVRVIDESGEDYLYPSRMFLRVRVKPEGRTKLLRILSLSSRKRPKNSKASRERQTGTVKRSSKRRYQ